jgi:rhamnosyl/mannosyltransferase
VLGLAKRIILTGPFMKDQPLVAPHASRARVIPLGVDLEVFCPRDSGPDVLAGVGRPRVLFVGRLRYYKGLSVLAAALCQLEHAQLVVVGDGPERGELEASLQAHNCRDRAHLLGEIDNAALPRVFRAADVAVLASTSNAEAFGLSIAEAQACGVPAVTTDVGTGTAQTVADGVSGRIVTPGDPRALAEAISWCLDPTRAPALRAAARRHAEEHLCARRMAAAVHELYVQVRAERLSSKKK